MNKCNLFLSLTVLFISNSCFAQNKDQSLSFIGEAKISASSFYTKLMDAQSGIYNGAEYINYDSRINDHPFFETDYYSYASVEYNSRVYDSVFLKYDVTRDLLVVDYVDHAGYSKDLILNNTKIGYFVIEGHYFIKVSDQKPLGSLKEGFYDLVFDGDVQIRARRKKVFFEEIVDLKLVQTFITKDQFYVSIDGDFHEVRTKGALLKLFATHKSELKKYIKANLLDFRGNFESALLSVTKQYINLNTRNEKF